MKKTKTHQKLLAGCMGFAALFAGHAAAQTYAITNARLLMVGNGPTPATIEGATLIIRNGKIAALGAGVTVPSGVRVIDAKGAPVTPGLFAPLSGLGLEEISSARESNDRTPQGDVGATASLDASDGFYPDSSVIPISRAGGVTRAFTALDSGESLVSGCAAIVDLSGGIDPFTTRCAALRISLGYAGAARVGNNRPAAMAAFRRILGDAKDFAEDPFLYRRQANEMRLSPQDAAALVPALRGEQKLAIEVHGAADIRRVLNIAEEYSLDIVLVGATEAHRLASELAAAKVPVIMNPLHNLPNRFETMGATLKAAGILEKAGVSVAFYDGDIGYTHNLRLLPQLAGNAVANGMSYDGALAAITSTPAKIWGLDDRLGTLAIGKIADVVVWDGDPLELSSRPSYVFIAGKPMSLDHRQKALVERYKDLSQGDLPFAYRGD